MSWFYKNSVIGKSEGNKYKGLEHPNPMIEPGIEF